MDEDVDEMLMKMMKMIEKEILKMLMLWWLLMLEEGKQHGY